MTESVLLRDVISIPERAGAEDYVLKLTEGVGQGRLDATITDYVVTDDIVKAFDDALDLVAAALGDGMSRASFLSGSFGSGKSHFMAVLYALLGHNPTVRAKAELASVLATHDSQLQDKKILRLAFHFLDAQSIEQCLLGGYVAQVRALHPDALLPAVHRSDELLLDAERMRANLGDDAFLAGLNNAESVGGAAGSVWGKVLNEGNWTAASYDAARAAAPGSRERQALASALVKAYFTAFTTGAEFVDLDTGLAAISDHAKSLGYDAIVMFLDELVLWLAFRVRDAEFFGREAQKVTKFVEANNIRAVPIVTFVARQLDLRRYFSESGGGVGAEQDALDAAFRHQEGRFRSIVLGDDNLPYVAEKRLLKPVSDSAKATLDEAFARIDRTPAVWDVLLDGVGTEVGQRGADQAAFRRTYPFSPALVSTLRTLASAMQRDRTALKVMQQLLVDQRDYLTVSNVIPVGDTFDLVVHGNQAITADMQGRFRNAKELYDNKLRPLLLREHELSEEEAHALPPGHAFRTDDRLVKTLVLSAVASEVSALKELTAGRLAALNHGSIVSPLPGQEASVVLTKLKRWNAEIPEIHISSDVRNPIIRLKISEVDYESIVEKAKVEDSDGKRRQLIKALVWEAFNLEQLEDDITGVNRQNRVWRGSRRDVEVVFGNVRDHTWLAEETFKAGRDTWRFVVDYPFDDQGHSVRDDDRRVDDLSQRGLVTNTVVWLPHFISAERRNELGRLAILDWLLSGPGDRWQNMSNDLPVADRPQARSILENQRDALRERLRRVIQEAYGAARPTPGNLDLDEGHDRVLRSLNPEFNPQAPVGHDLAAAFGNLVDQVFSTSFPGHPKFEPADSEVKPNDLQRALEAVQLAHQDPDGRVFIETANREGLRRIANPLGIGHMGETHYLFGSDRFTWSMKFARAMGSAGIDMKDPVTVGTLRQWIREDQPASGLRPEVADLVISAWAVEQGRAWYRHGSTLTPAPRPGQITDEMELRPEPLPSTEDWQAAVRRAAVLLGVTGSTFLTGASVGELTAGIRERLSSHSTAARALPGTLAKAYEKLGITAGASASGRYSTANGVATLVANVLAQTDNVALISTFANASLPGTDEAAARSLSTASSVTGSLEGFNWDRLKPLLDAETQTDLRGTEARDSLARLRSALVADELAQSISSALQRADDDAFAWLASAATPTPPPGSQPAPAPLPQHTASGKREVSTRADIVWVTADIEAFVEEHGDQNVVVEWRVEP
ncbi:phage resistance protein [Mycobacterium deserti]|uniref:Phage resistance protein n=1 Tax=Mycobacterium deserti TaxID=2978347 RepID=A0ABT2M5U4_9MYCO|nr:phage resistance protein [Mycobacterium deserti]MCT7657636.1 phage resistance protein [Mycobacterium deserti]